MGWIDNFRGMSGQQPGLPSSPFGGPIDPFGTALGETGLPGTSGLGGLPPTPFGGDAGAWPSGVPNPLGLPSPGQIGQTIGGWFTNPYGTHGSVPNPSPLNGINPYGSQVSGGTPLYDWQIPAQKWGATGYQRNAFTNGGFSGNYGGPLPGMWDRPNDPNARGDTATIHQGNTIVRQGWNTPRPPPALKPPPTPPAQHSQTLDRWGGGIGTGGPFGARHQQGTASVGGPPNWHDVPMWQGSAGGGKP